MKSVLLEHLALKIRTLDYIAQDLDLAHPPLYFVENVQSYYQNQVDSVVGIRQPTLFANLNVHETTHQYNSPFIFYRQKIEISIPFPSLNKITIVSNCNQ